MGRDGNVENSRRNPPCAGHTVFEKHHVLSYGYLEGIMARSEKFGRISSFCVLFLIFTVQPPSIVRRFSLESSYLSFLSGKSACHKMRESGSFFRAYTITIPSNDIPKEERKGMPGTSFLISQDFDISLETGKNLTTMKRSFLLCMLGFPPDPAMMPRNADP